MKIKKQKRVQYLRKLHKKFNFKIIYVEKLSLVQRLSIMNWSLTENDKLLSGYDRYFQKFCNRRLQNSLVF